MIDREFFKDKRHGIVCLECGRILVSYSRHNYKTCGCPNETMIDGGTDYIHSGAMDLRRTASVEIQLVLPTKRKRVKK